MGYCCLEMKKIKTMGNLQKCFEHNFREANTTFPHVESKDTVLNHELVGHPPVTYGDLFEFVIMLCAVITLVLAIINAKK